MRRSPWLKWSLFLSMKIISDGTMLGLRAAACTIAMCVFAGPVAAQFDCPGSRCVQLRLIPPPKAQHHSLRKQRGCCQPPAGWGWYRRHKYHHDFSQPLVVFDELGGIVSVHQNW